MFFTMQNDVIALDQVSELLDGHMVRVGVSATCLLLLDFGPHAPCTEGILRTVRERVLKAVCLPAKTLFLTLLARILLVLIRLWTMILSQRRICIFVLERICDLRL